VQSSKVKDERIKSKQSKTKIQSSVLRVNSDAELQKSLDLSIPFKDIGTNWMKIEESRAVPGELLNMFAKGNKRRPQPLNLDGQMLMSQEPEVDKRKSFDGAGIVINLKQ
jgi:hypothetical protein